MRKKSKTGKGPGFGTRLHAIVKLMVIAGTAFTMLAFAGQAPKTADDRVPVRYTDVRQAAGITFLQDATRPTKSIIWKPWAPASPGSTTTRTG